MSAPALLAHGHSPIPIAPGDKLPGRFGASGWSAMSGWTAYCATPATPNKIRSWSRYPDAGVSVALGRGLLSIDIDQDELVVPALAVLPPVVVAKKGRKGLTVFFRANTDLIASRNFLGLLDVLSHGRQTVLPPSIHPAGMPYVYTTPRTLEDTRLDELPLYTAEHDAALVALLRKRGATIPEKPAPARLHQVTASREAGSGEFADLKALALADLPAWVPDLGLAHIERHGEGYRAIAEWRASGNGKALAARGWNLGIHPSGIRDFGTNEGFSAIDLVMRARDLELPEAIRWLAERLNFTLASNAPVPDMLAGQARSPAGPAPVVIPPRPHPDVARDEVATKIAAVVAHAWDYKARERARKEAKKRGVLRLPPIAQHVALVAETGISKSTTARLVTSKAIPAGLEVSYFAPTTERCDEFAANYKDRGIDARTLRGLEKDDPRLGHEGKKMCVRPKAIAAAASAGVDFKTSACERKQRSGLPLRCPHFDTCGYQVQAQARPQIWLLPHSSHFVPKPSFIPEPDLRIVDEQCHDKGVAKPLKGGESGDRGEGGTFALSLSHIGLAAPFEAGDLRDDLTDFRRRLATALGGCEGYVSRASLVAAGIRAGMAERAERAEGSLWKDPGLNPAQTDAEQERRVDRVNDGNADANNRRLVAHWVLHFLRNGGSESGRLFVKGGKLEVRPFAEFHHSWGNGPTLFLDAFAPSKDVLANVLGAPATRLKPILAKWSDDVFVRVIRNAHVSASKLGTVKSSSKSPPSRNLVAVWRLLVLRAAEVFPHIAAVAGPKKAIDRLKAMGLPANVDARHYNALAGFDGWGRVPYLMTFGYPRTPSRALEATAACFWGEPPEAIPDEGRPVFGYPQAEKVIRLRNGHGVLTTCDAHPDEEVEQLRKLGCDAEIKQGIGRVRPHNRTPETPCLVEVVGDFELEDIPVDEVLSWDDVMPGAWADMIPSGVLLTTAVDIQAVYGVSEKAARIMAEGATLWITGKKCPHYATAHSLTSAPKPVVYNIGLGADVAEFARLRKITIKRHGRTAEALAFALPSAPMKRKDIRLGPMRAIPHLKRFEVEGEPRSTLAETVAACASPLARILAAERDRQERLSALIEAACTAVGQEE